jgi:hypothetical protein
MTMMFMHGYLLVGVSLEKLVWSRHIVITGGGIAAESLVASAGSLFYFSSPFIFVMCMLSLVIMLLRCNWHLS